MILRVTVLRSIPTRAAGGVTTGHTVVGQSGPLHITAHMGVAPPPADGAIVDLDLTEQDGEVSAVAGWTLAPQP